MPEENRINYPEFYPQNGEKVWWVVCQSWYDPDGPAKPIGPYRSIDQCEADLFNNAGCDNKHFYGCGRYPAIPESLLFKSWECTAMVSWQEAGCPSRVNSNTTRRDLPELEQAMNGEYIHLHGTKSPIIRTDRTGK